MLFNRLCKYAELWKQEKGEVPKGIDPIKDKDHVLFHAMNKVKLFHWDIDPMDIDLKVDTYSDLVEKFDNLFLPFDSIAIEDCEACTLLLDLRPEQKGAVDPRFFTVALPMFELPKNIIPENLTEQYLNNLRKMGKLIDKGTTFISGTVQSFKVLEAKDVSEKIKAEHEASAEYYAEADIGWHKLATLTPDNKLTTQRMKPMDQCDDSTKNMRYIVKAALENAMKEIALINNATNFILETAPIKERRQAKNRIARAADRSTFTFLNAKEIREKLGWAPPEPGSGRKQGPHDRRRHERTLRSDAFKHRQGEKIMIPACWIGPTEAIRGSHKYIVRIDI